MQMQVAAAFPASLVPESCSPNSQSSQDRVHCTPCSLNIYLGKASNPGLGRAWLGASAILIWAQEPGGGGGGQGHRVAAPLSGWGQGKDRLVWFQYFNHASLSLTQFSHVLLSALQTWGLHVRGGRGSSPEALFIFITARGSGLETGGICRAQRAWQEGWVRGADAGLLQGGPAFGGLALSPV